MKKKVLNFKISVEDEEEDETIKNCLSSVRRIKRGVKITVFFMLLNYQMGKKVCRLHGGEREW